MSCGCLILTPKYQLASRMNSIFPFWTNARLVDSANVSTGPVSNGLRVTGGLGGVVKLAHLSRPILLLLLQYIRLQREKGGLDSDTRGTNSAILREERRRGELSFVTTVKLLEMRISDPVCSIRLWCVCMWCSVVQVITMKTIHSLTGILLVLGFIQSSWQVPLLEADDSSRYRTHV